MVMIVMKFSDQYTLILELFFSYIAIEINEIINLISCKQFGGSQTEWVIYIRKIVQILHLARLQVLFFVCLQNS